MFSITMISAPDNASLSAAEAEHYRSAWCGGALEWLSENEAVTFPVPERPEHFSEARQALAERRIDLAICPAKGRKKRLLIADMDSTMIAQECIDELADYAGVGPQVSAITEAAMRGEHDFESALLARVALLEGLPVRAIDEVMSSRIHVNPGARTLIQTMRKHGAFLMLVSGGFSIFAAAIAAKLGFHTHYANRLEFDKGRLTGKVIPPVLGRKEKRVALEKCCTESRIALEETMAVGDGANDLDMISASGLGVAYHAKPALDEVADISIKFSDLSALLFVQGYSREQFVL